jgi:hypothetical protein
MRNFSQGKTRCRAAARKLLSSLHTHAAPRDREVEAEKAKEVRVTNLAGASLNHSLLRRFLGQISYLDQFLHQKPHSRLELSEVTCVCNETACVS